MAFNAVLLYNIKGLRKCQNPEEWQLEPLWEIHGHPVWPPGGRKCIHYITLQKYSRFALSAGLPFSLRGGRWVVTSWVTCWRSPVWSTRTTARETSTSSISWWREERRNCCAGSAWRETARTTVTWCRSVGRKRSETLRCGIYIFIYLVQQNHFLSQMWCALSPSGWLCQSELYQW